MSFVRRKVTQPAEPGRQKEQNCDELAAALEDAVAATRRQAARDLVHAPHAAKKLVSRLKRERDAAVREVILNSLVRLNDATAIGGLVDCLRSEDAALRNEVIESFKQMGDEAAPVLRSLQFDSDPDVRIFLVNILESVRHPEVESTLIEVIEQDSHVNVCATAVDLLCEVGTKAAINPLLRLKARFRAEEYIQFAADLALKRIREA